MAVSIKFDANQPFQREAIDAVLDVFAGQESMPQGTQSGDLTRDDAMIQQLVYGNSLALAPETIRRNLRAVQDRLVEQDNGEVRASIPEDLRMPFNPNAPLDLSVEMETGTGKTYVYLRTIIELNQCYGFTKFVIVVPSVSIREGVLANLNLLKSHIKEIYDGVQYDSYVYDSKKLNQVRQFATSPHLQIMVINISGFDTQVSDDGSTSRANIIHRSREEMNGAAPIEFLRACHPVVIMDEPQNMETPIRQNAIASLSPLFRLRYSATHKDLKHLVYRLTPVDAYDLRLVKRIGVLSVVKEDDLNEAYVEVSKITPSKTDVTATALIHKATRQGTKRTRVTLRKDSDLFEVSGGRDIYKGWIVEDIHADTSVVEFGNGRTVALGASSSAADDQQQRLMLRKAIESHFEKELQLENAAQFDHSISARIKPLTLFFIREVSDYHQDGSKLRRWFEEEYESVRHDDRFMLLDMPPAAQVHAGYFSVDRKGAPKNTGNSESADAADAYELIMRDKERLLSFDGPTRFIFSHSALAEGWDNPNVFTICNLQDPKSEIRQRQQVGRGMRLPVMENGERCRVDEINLLTVIANQSFADYAGALQKEIENDTGVMFDDRIIDLNKGKTTVTLKEGILDDPIFKALWERISPKTTYQVDFDTEAVVAGAIERIDGMPDIEPVKFVISKSEINITTSGLSSAAPSGVRTQVADSYRQLPDVVGELCRRLPLSRATVVRILRDCHRLDQLPVNPSVFMDQVERAINNALYDQVAHSIIYTPVGDRWSAELFVKQKESVAPIVIPVSKSITDKVVCDSIVEQKFAEFLDSREDVPLFIKLPDWFKIPTPLGNYNPDWAFVREMPEGTHLYLVRETKGANDIKELRFESEGWKIEFGEAHFEKALHVDFFFGSNPRVLVEPSQYWRGHQPISS